MNFNGEGKETKSSAIQQFFFGSIDTSLLVIRNCYIAKAVFPSLESTSNPTRNILENIVIPRDIPKHFIKDFSSWCPGAYIKTNVSK